jgi:LDH2 family malate/lactate/ureidoglycolate dehydrogenase
MPENMPGNGIGHFFGAMRIDAFRPAEDFKNNMDNWIQEFKKAKTIEGIEKVIIPGEPETEMEKYRLQHGMTLVQSIIDDLSNLAEKFNVPFGNRS